MNPEFIAALKDIEKERAIPLEVIIAAIEDALTAAYKRNYASGQDVAVRIDRVTGLITARVSKEVVERVKHPLIEISLKDARAINKAALIGEFVEVTVVPDDFGRIAAQTAKQVIVQRIREAERDVVFGEYTKEDESLVTGIVQRYEQKTYTVDLGRMEAVLPASEQVPTEHFRHGDRMKAVVIRALKTAKGPQIIISRTVPALLARLFENEVPEIKSGLVSVKSVVREPGNRSKIAVESHDPKIDPVGACVGPKGSRVQLIVDELKNEKIDIINWSSDPVTYIAASLSPAKVLSVKLYPYDKSALVIVPDNQLSLAIGKEGQNVRLAARLTGWKIDIKSETQYAENREELEARAAELERLHREQLLNEQLKKEAEQAQEESLEVVEEESSEEVVEEHLEEPVEEVVEEYLEEPVEEVVEESVEESVDEPLEESIDESVEDYIEENAPELPQPEPTTEEVSDKPSRRKKRKERRAEEERDEMLSRKQHKKSKRSRGSLDYEDDPYGGYKWN